MGGGDWAYRIPICLKTMFRPKTFITCRFYFFFLATTSRSAQVIGKNHIPIYKNVINYNIIQNHIIY